VYAVTNPYPVVDRIPEDQPYIVRLNSRKLIIRVGVAAVVLGVIMAAISFAALADDSLGAAFGMLGFTVLIVVLMVVPTVRMVTAGPVLAVGPAGLWIKTRPGGRRQAIWLPWESIAMITRFSRQVNFAEQDRYLVVRPADPRASQGLGAASAIGNALWRMSSVFSTMPDGFVATIKHSDRPEAEILQAVAYYAANRVPLG
jgi:hypothetical protein